MAHAAPMMLESIRIENYRSIRDETLHCNELTALVGANGSGKSSFLRAIALFFAEKPDLTEDDYYARRATRIRVTATFGGLSDAAKEQLGDYVLDGRLTVAREFEFGGKPNPPYRGMMLQNPDFATIYAKKRGVKNIYEELREKDKYADLPKWTRYDEVIDVLMEWEDAHPDHKRETFDNGIFLQGYSFPERFVQFLHIEPVRDASQDALEGRNSTLTRLVDIAVRNSLMTNENIKKFADGYERKYKQIMDSTGRTKLDNLGNGITRTVRQFVPDAEVDLSWSQPDLDIKLPTAKIRLGEDGYQTAVGGAGHGLQRIFMMSILQHLAGAQADTESTAAELPALILAIDEPEIYQHPNRQRNMSQVLLSLATKGIPGAAGKTQIVYSTHSPHFVGIDRLDQIRLVRKAAGDNDGPKATRLSSTSLEAVADTLSHISKRAKVSAEQLRRRLRVVMSPVMNEGFFADAIVLVEGEGDRAALAKVADLSGYHLERRGISIIPCGGKANISGPAAIFRSLDIPLYVVWDADSNKAGARLNRTLLSAIGERPAGLQLGVQDTYACLDSKLEDVIKEGLGDKRKEYCDRCRRDLGVKYNDVFKKPHAIGYIIGMAMDGGCAFGAFEDILQNAIGLRRKGSQDAGA